MTNHPDGTLPASLFDSERKESKMTQVVAVVVYGLPEGTDRATAVQMFRDSIPRYMTTPGLLRKNVLYDEGLGGGVYLFESRQAADAAFSDEWKTYMTDKYDHPPQITFYESPITMDQQYGCVYDERNAGNVSE